MTVASAAGAMLVPLCASVAAQPAPRSAPSAGATSEQPKTPAVEKTELHAKPTLIAEHREVVPGERTRLVLKFAIRPHWHMYWNGQNDTGLPASWQTRDWPRGFEITASGWPGPRRMVLPGDIRDHIYEDEFGVVLEVQVPSDAQPGSTVTLPLHVEWMVCDTMCVLEQQDVSIALAVVEKRAPKREGERMEPGVWAVQAARAAIPRGGTLALEATSRATVRRDASELVLNVAGATEIEFYPASGASEPASPIEGTAGRGDTLRVKFADAAATGKSAGIVAWRTEPTSRWEYDWVSPEGEHTNEGKVGEPASKANAQ